MRKLAETLCVALLVVACSKSQGSKTGYYVLHGIEGSGLAAVEDTVSEIEHRSGGKILHDSVGELMIEISWGDLSGNTIGRAKSNGYFCEIQIKAELNSDSPGFKPYYDLRLVIMHEIGHCFGLDHSPTETDIMFWESNPEIQNNEKSTARFINQLNEVRKSK